MGDMAEEAIMQSQAHIWKLMFAFADTMALKCAVDLSIADIINTHGRPITLSQIANSINSPCPDINCLSRIMRFLVRKSVFTAQATNGDGDGDILYGLTHAAKWLLRDTEFSLAPMVQGQTHQWLMAPWHFFSKCVQEGGSAFSKAHGSEIWDFASVQPEFNKIFNSAMACTANMFIDAFLSTYKNGFDDVGGGTGMLIREIVKAHPHVRGFNFDLPHVVATAPECTGIEHIGGDMFVEIPPSDSVIIKWILHDWTDEDCVMILKNCRKAMVNERGKLIIVDVVLKPEGVGIFDEIGLISDLAMMAHSTGGKERTETEWEKLLNDGGFPRYKIIQIPLPQSIIEAYPS